jgi:hypothetical protein
MKTILLVVLAACALGAVCFYTNEPTLQAVAPSAPAKAATNVTASVTTPAITSPVQAAAPAITSPVQAAAATPPAAPTPKSEPTVADEFTQAIEIVRSSQATFDEKQAAWEQLRNNGQLDQVIAALEQDAATNPDSAETMVALGRAYMFKSGTVQDVAEVGALGIKIDQAFASALKVDPTNWDAQYFKAVSLSFYPAFMNKGPEVIAGFQSLIQQQETQPVQPEFANTYLQLGDQYQKQGNNDEAQQAWQRGAALFPDNEALKEKVSPPAAQP